MENITELRLCVNNAFMAGALSKLGLENAKIAIKRGRTAHLRVLLKALGFDKLETA